MGRGPPARPIGMAWHGMIGSQVYGLCQATYLVCMARQPDTNFQWAVPAGTLPRNGGRHLTTHTESILYNPIQRNESMLWENEVVDWAEKRGPRETETVRTYFKF